MKRILCVLLIMTQQHLISWEKLNDKYCVSFGNPKALNQVTEYFSFACPHCVALFKAEFSKIKDRLIDSDKVYWTFHPIPADLQTIQAMMCLENLPLREKKLFLEVLLEEADMEDPEITSQLMQRAMEILNKPIPDLQNKNFISESNAFQAAFEFLKQEDHIKAIPSVEINGRLFPSAIPECAFVEGHLKKDYP